MKRFCGVFVALFLLILAVPVAARTDHPNAQKAQPIGAIRGAHLSLSGDEIGLLASKGNISPDVLTAVKRVGGLPEVPFDEITEAERPSLFVYVEGDGTIRVSGKMPITPGFPVVVLAKRTECRLGCPYDLAGAVWPQTVLNGLINRPVQWLRPAEQRPDELNWADGGGFDLPGLRIIKVAVLNLDRGVFMTQRFAVNVEPFDFSSYSLFVGGGVLVNLQLDSLQKLEDGARIALTIDGRSGYTAVFNVDEREPRRAIVPIFFPLGQLPNGTVLVSITLPDGTSREKLLTLVPSDSCGNGKG